MLPASTLHTMLLATVCREKMRVSLKLIDVDQQSGVEATASWEDCSCAAEKLTIWPNNRPVLGGGAGFANVRTYISSSDSPTEKFYFLE